jgi:hypothetical protein
MEGGLRYAASKTVGGCIFMGDRIEELAFEHPYLKMQWKSNVYRSLRNGLEALFYFYNVAQELIYDVDLASIFTLPSKNNPI